MKPRVETSILLSEQTLIIKIPVFLVAVEACLVLFDIVFNYNRAIPAGSIQRLFNMAREDSLSAWISTVQTFCVSLIIFLIYRATRLRGWAFIAGFFFYLAMDDGAKMHERIGTAVKDLFLENQSRKIALPSYTWQFVLGPVFAAIGFYILYYVLKNARDRVVQFLILLALTCYAVAVGLDYVEGMESGYETVAIFVGASSQFINHFGRVLEEFLEMLGTSIFLVAFLRQLSQVSSRVVLQLGKVP